MFWALALQPYKKYTQTVEKTLHVSMASMDLTSSGNEPVRILVSYDKKQYLICTLKKDKMWQVPLDLNFKKGSPVSFVCDGHGYVHLTGYLLPNKGVDYSDTDSEEDKETESKKISQWLSTKRKAEPQDHNSKRAKLTREESFDESSDDDTDFSDSYDSSSSLEDYLDDKDMENEEKEENYDEDEEENEQEHEQEKLATSPKHEGKKIEKQQPKKQQKKNKHNKQDEINGEEIEQEQQGKKQKKKVEQQAEQKDNKNIISNIKKKTLEGGVQVEDIKIGTGLIAVSGSLVTVHYTGHTKIGKEVRIVDEVKPGSKGFKLRLGRGRSIKGFEVGVIGMKVGGKRRITIPPNMGYGAKGLLPVIPPDSKLVYDVELAKVIY